MDNTKIIRKYIRFYGRVQCVGFRYTAQQAARSVKATGWVHNEYDGSVSMEIQGREEQLDHVLVFLNNAAYIRIDRMETQMMTPVPDEKRFVVK